MLLYTYDTQSTPSDIWHSGRCDHLTSRIHLSHRGHSGPSIHMIIHILRSPTSHLVHSCPCTHNIQSSYFTLRTLRSMWTYVGRTSQVTQGTLRSLCTYMILRAYYHTREMHGIVHTWYWELLFIHRTLRSMWTYVAQNSELYFRTLPYLYTHDAQSSPSHWGHSWHCIHLTLGTPPSHIQHSCPSEHMTFRIHPSHRNTYIHVTLRAPTSSIRYSVNIGHWEFTHHTGDIHFYVHTDNQNSPSNCGYLWHCKHDKEIPLST